MIHKKCRGDKFHCTSLHFTIYNITIRGGKWAVPKARHDRPGLSAGSAGRARVVPRSGRAISFFKFFY